MIAQSKWIWFGHAAHYICARRCRWHLCTQVGQWLVSSVGDFRIKDDEAMSPIGLEHFFETMVFRAEPNLCTAPDCQCGMPKIVKWQEEEVLTYQTAGEAAAGHMRLCTKWAKRHD